MPQQDGLRAPRQPGDAFPISSVVSLQEKLYQQRNIFSRSANEGTRIWMDSTGKKDLRENAPPSTLRPQIPVRRRNQTYVDSPHLRKPTR